MVEEIPAYEPSGTGAHTFVEIEKRDLTTHEAIRRLAQAAGCDPRDVGYAGLKDRHATTRQWLSFPALPADRASALGVEGIRVLRAVPHPHKLRMGHLHGNRFEVVLEDVDETRARAVVGALASLAAEGLPNRYGTQRFGAAGDNVNTGLALMRGERRERDRRRRQLLLSAVQSAVFNRVLDLRVEGKLVRRVLHGDVLRKTDTGGLFGCEDPAADQARLDAGALVITGPLPGTRSIAPAPGSAAAALEDRAAADVGLLPQDLERAGRELPGARRPLLVPVTVTAEARRENLRPALRLFFSLPAGSYATEVVGALLHAPP